MDGYCELREMELKIGTKDWEREHRWKNVR